MKDCLESVVHVVFDGFSQVDTLQLNLLLATCVNIQEPLDHLSPVAF